MGLLLNMCTAVVHEVFIKLVIDAMLSPPVLCLSVIIHPSQSISGKLGKIC